MSLPEPREGAGIWRTHVAYTMTQGVLQTFCRCLTVKGAMVFAGVLLPYGIFIPWLIEYGPNPVLLINEAALTRIGAFAWLDAIVSALALLGLIFIEGRRLGMKGIWIPAVGTCLVGVSLGLPLFLLMREIHRENHHAG